MLPKVFKFTLVFTGEQIEKDKKYSLCELSAEGVYPTMTIIG